MMERRLEAMSSELDRRLVDLDRRLYLGLDSVQLAQAQAGDVAADVRERVATVSGIAQQVLDHARDLARLEDLLRPPQARGAFGEVLLEHLLAQGLPEGCWRAQHAFRSGTRVDAVLVLGGALVPVDSKFPLDAFARMAAAGEGDATRGLHRRAFVRDARRHVAAIADKYIRPDEGTFDFALCYLPSEAVYYEFLREDPAGESPFRSALDRGGAARAQGRGRSPPHPRRPGGPARRPRAVPDRLRGGRQASGQCADALGGGRPPARPPRRPPRRGLGQCRPHGVASGHARAGAGAHAGWVRAGSWPGDPARPGGARANAGPGPRRGGAQGNRLNQMSDRPAPATMSSRAAAAKITVTSCRCFTKPIFEPRSW